MNGTFKWSLSANFIPKPTAMRLKHFISFLLFVFSFSAGWAQKVNWTADGLYYTRLKDGNMIKVDPKTDAESILFKRESLIPAGSTEPLKVQDFHYSSDGKYVLLFANTAKVWRYNTRGDYWLMDLATQKLRQVGSTLAPRSLMFAKISPDSKQVAYVSGNNIYSEDINSGIQKKLTIDGTRKMINGTFDWVYEEEFHLRDGFRWSPDSRNIAYWQINANAIRDFYMINNTDSVYSQIIPVEYPKVGEKPSPARIGVVSLANSVTRWMKPEGDPSQHYITRMEWSGPDELIIQQLDRKQQESKLMYCNAQDGNTRTFWAENDEAWVDLNTDNPVGWNWVNKGQDFLWVSEKDGWRSIYKISRDGKNTTLLTKGEYDIDEIQSIDEANNFVYFTASPDNPVQRYLYRVKINGSQNSPELLSTASQKGTHSYEVSPTSKMARHTFSNHNTPPVAEWITLPDGRPVNASKSIAKNLKIHDDSKVEYFKVTTDDGIELDAWINKPVNFDPSKKYPVVFYVYGEPGSSTVNDSYGEHNNFLYAGDMREEGYVQASVDCRGTPVLKGAKWRKAIYAKNGQVNISDVAGGAKKILELPFIDKKRAAIWGWSGGGATTLHILFKYPDLFQTGISISAITNLLNYDNIYTERYMGLPEENREAYEKGSAINYAANLKGNLLFIHGTGDDNVHYSNAEMLLNELIKHNKQFTFMPYPNRTHGLSEGRGTFKHLTTLYTNFLRKHCEPGAR